MLIKKLLRKIKPGRFLVNITGKSSYVRKITSTLQKPEYTIVSGKILVLRCESRNGEIYENSLLISFPESTHLNRIALGTQGQWFVVNSKKYLREILLKVTGKDYSILTCEEL